MSLIFKIKAVIICSLFLFSKYPENKAVSQNIDVQVEKAPPVDSVTILRKEYKEVKDERTDNIERLGAAKQKAEADAAKYKKQKETYKAAWIESQNEIIALKKELAFQTNKPFFEIHFPDSTMHAMEDSTLPVKEDKPKKVRKFLGIKY